jgi:D-3-phosphoglycerate dehydrogenase / 2-oxoglutarate reductase
MKVLIAAPISKDFESFLLAQKAELIDYDGNLEYIADYAGIVTSTKLQINQQFIDKATNLLWIARLGSGLEIIDIAYAAQKKIQCFSSPAGIANAVAEHVLAMIICLQKNICTSANQVANHAWIREPNRGQELENKTVGIIGYGHTGSAVAKKLSVFGCKILAYDPFKTITDQYVQQVQLQDIYDNADIVSYHVPLLPEMIGYYQPQLFVKPHLLINTSRGAIAPTDTILQGLSSGKTIAAGLDVLDFEHQTPFDDEAKYKLDSLLKYHCIITPHIAGYSFNAIQKMSKELMNQLKINVFYE